MFRALGDFAGWALGRIGGATVAVVAEVLEVPVRAVQSAINAGCETYEDVREFCKDWEDDGP